MGFYEDIARALDAEGIESRVNDGMLFVPVSEEVDIQFERIEAERGIATPAAHVFVAMADVSEDDEEFDAALVGVVFTPEAAVAAVNKHIATDQVVTVLNELLEGQDPRIDGLDFVQDEREPLVVDAEVAEASSIIVQIDEGERGPEAQVTFVSLPQAALELADDVAAEIFATEDDEDDPEKIEIFDSVLGDLQLQHQEVLELGTFTDVDQLFDVLAYASQYAEEWEFLLETLDDGSDSPYEELLEEDLDEESAD